MHSGDLRRERCPLGSYCPAGTNTPIACNPGTYRSDPTRLGIDATSCITCPAGQCLSNIRCWCWFL